MTWKIYSYFTMPCSLSWTFNHRNFFVVVLHSSMLFDFTCGWPSMHCVKPLEKDLNTIIYHYHNSSSSLKNRCKNILLLPNVLVSRSIMSRTRWITCIFFKEMNRRMIIKKVNSNSYFSTSLLHILDINLTFVFLYFSSFFKKCILNLNLLMFSLYNCVTS